MGKEEEQKIDNAYKQKQLLEWKQDYYQEIATKLNDFYDEYLSSSSSIAEKLQQLSSTSSNSTYVKAIASSSASSGSIYIDDIKSLATAAKLKGTATVSPELSFTVDTTDLSSLSGSSFNITLDGVSETITFADGTYSSSSDVATALQSLVDNALGSGRITISGDDGNLTFSSTNSKISISDTSTETDTQALGILGFDS